MNPPIPPPAAATLVVFLVQASALLALAVVLGRLAARLGMPQVVGELCAGLLLGPSLLGHVAPAVSRWLFPPHRLDMLDGVGVVGMLLLVGVTGTSLDIGLLRRQGPRAGVVSITSLVIPLGLGVACGFALPAVLLPASRDRVVFASFLGVAMCVSALPVIAKILTELGYLHRDVGQLTIMAAGVDDVVGWLLLAVVSAMATTGVRVGAVTMSVVVLAAVLLVAVALRPVIRVALRATTESGTSVAVLVVILLAGAAATQALKLEGLLGAFLLGIVATSTGALDHARIVSLRTIVLNVLAPIFFATAGLRMDLTVLRHPAVAVAAVVVVAVAVVGKFAGAWLGATIIRLDRWRALALGAGLNARGVVQIVVASVGLRTGVLNTAGYTIVVLVAITTSLMAPPLLRLAIGRLATTPDELRRERDLALSAPPAQP